MSCPGIRIGLILGNTGALSGGGSTPVPPNGIFAMPVTLAGRGSSTYNGVGSTSPGGVNDFLGLTKALVSTPSSVNISGSTGGTTSDISDAFTNPANSRYVTTAQKAGTISMELFGGSDVVSGSEATLIGLVQSALATLPDLSRFYYIVKYNVNDASSASSGARANVARRMEALYPAATIDWAWYMRNLPTVTQVDIDAQALNLLPPTYSNNDNLHMDVAGYAGTEANLFEHMLRGQATQLPFVADGRILYSRAATANTIGGLVADIPILDDLTGCTLSTTSTDFAFAQTPANTKSIRVTRASATVLKAMYTLVPLTLTKAVGSQTFTRTINLRIGIGIPQPAAPAINRWNGSGLSNGGLANPQTLTDFSMVVGLRIPAALDGLAVTLMSSNGFTLVKGASGLVTLTIKQFGNTSNAIVCGQDTTKGLRLTSANGFIWYYFEGSTVTGSQSNKMYVNDTDSVGAGGTNVADSVLGFWKAGGITLWNNGSPDANVVNFNATIADENIPQAVGTILLHVMRVQAPQPAGIYPNATIAGAGVTAASLMSYGLNDGGIALTKASTVASLTAMTATFTNSMRPVNGAYVDACGPFFYPGKIGVSNSAIRSLFKDGSGNPVDPGTTVAGLTPFIDLRGNAADMWRGADGTDGGYAKNYGNGGDFAFREREIGSLVTV